MQQLSSLMGGMEGSLTREDMRSAFEAGPQVGPGAACLLGPAAARALPCRQPDNVLTSGPRLPALTPRL